MNPELFEQWMLTGLVVLLVAFMAFIIWDLARQSGAGRRSRWILFGVLGLGMLAFVIKTIAVAVL